MKHPTGSSRALAARMVLLVLAAVLTGGCASTGLNSARREFYRGHIEEADAQLAAAEIVDRDRVLFLMEDAAIEQALGNYEASAKALIEASSLLDKLETYSVSKGGASLVINDSVQDFRGTPYERTMVHSMNALNHLALGHWDNAAVEARRIIQTLHPDVIGDYPEDAFSRYIAGFCLELINDYSNAALQYRKANELAPQIQIDELSGGVRFGPKPAPPEGYALPHLPAEPSSPGNMPAELICFVLMGRGPSGQELVSQYYTEKAQPYAEIQVDGQTLGRSYALTDLYSLASITENKLAAAKALKTAARIVAKDAIAQAVADGTDNEAVGMLIRLILIGMLERPDIRRWETLPHSMQVIRAPCPADLSSFTLILKSPSGAQLGPEIVIEDPIRRHGDRYISIYRDFTTR